MGDLDSIADLDPLTGLPAVDTRTTATRWLECLHHGPTFHVTPNVVPHFTTLSTRSASNTKPTPPMTDPRAHLIK